MNRNLVKMAKEHCNHTIEHKPDPLEALDGRYKICVMRYSEGFTLYVDAMERENLTVKDAIERVLSREYDGPMEKEANALRDMVNNGYDVFVDTAGYWDDRYVNQFELVYPSQKVNAYIQDTIMDECHLRTVTLSLRDV